jgi:hypothetical protein
LAKNQGGLVDDIASHSATVGPSEKGDRVEGSARIAKRRRRSNRNKIRRRGSK